MALKTEYEGIKRCLLFNTSFSDTIFTLQVPILGSSSLILQKCGAVIDKWQIRSSQNLKIGGRQIPQSVPKPKEPVPPLPGTCPRFSTVVPFYASTLTIEAISVIRPYFQKDSLVKNLVAFKLLKRDHPCYNAHFSIPKGGSI